VRLLREQLPQQGHHTHTKVRLVCYLLLLLLGCIGLCNCSLCCYSAKAPFMLPP
jgi:hypothetical protein